MNGARKALLLVVAALAHQACSSSSSSPPSPMAPAPPAVRLTAIAPTLGSTTGGVQVTISGTNFGSDATFAVGGTMATQVEVQSPTTVAGLIGPHAAAGAADVVLTTGGKSVTLVNGFAFVAPSGANQPPVIASIRSIGTRPNQPSGFGDIDETVTLLATVTDNESLPSSLAYTWSGPGTFSGAGPSISWRLPAGVATPSPQSVALEVGETFIEGPVTHKNTSTGTFVMQVHNSQKEILDEGEDFLTLFSRSEVGTKDVLHSFSTTCDGGRGRGDEESDVDNNRATYVQDFGAFRISRRGPATLNFKSFCSIPDGRIQPNTDACASYAVHWEVNKRSNGLREITNGVDYVSAVLENNEWRLCHSSFIGTSTFPTLGITIPVSW